MDSIKDAKVTTLVVSVSANGEVLFTSIEMLTDLLSSLLTIKL